VTNRILLGRRGAESGLWISRPGVDVVSAGLDDLLFSTRQTLQIVQADQIVCDDFDTTSQGFYTHNVDHPNTVVVLPMIFRISRDDDALLIENRTANGWRIRTLSDDPYTLTYVLFRRPV
jgi:hypothetical protein